MNTRGHGGHRAGSGRKPTGQPRMVAIVVKVTPAQREALRLRFGNLSAGVRRLIEMYLAENPPKVD